jgi:uncharacterized membrane protein YsdA (DUF1294 family)
MILIRKELTKLVIRVKNGGDITSTRHTKWKKGRFAWGNLSNFMRASSIIITLYRWDWKNAFKKQHKLVEFFLRIMTQRQGSIKHYLNKKRTRKQHEKWSYNIILPYKKFHFNEFYAQLTDPVTEELHWKKGLLLGASGFTILHRITITISGLTLFEFETSHHTRHFLCMPERQQIKNTFPITFTPTDICWRSMNRINSEVDGENFLFSN